MARKVSKTTQAQHEALATVEQVLCEISAHDRLKTFVETDEQRRQRYVASRKTYLARHAQV